MTNAAKQIATNGGAFLQQAKEVFVQPKNVGAHQALANEYKNTATAVRTLVGAIDKVSKRLFIVFVFVSFLIFAKMRATTTQFEFKISNCCSNLIIFVSELFLFDFFLFHVCGWMFLN